MAGISNFPQGGAKINGIIESYKVQAGENISAGDFVSFVNASPTTGGTETKLSIGSPATIQAVLVAENTVLIAYRTYSGNKYTYAVAITINNNTVTYGTNTVISTTNQSTYGLELIALDNNKAVITMGGGTVVDTIVITVNDDKTLTIGTLYSITTQSSSATCKTLKLTNNTILLGYYYDTYPMVKVQVLSINTDDTISAGTPYSCTSSSAFTFCKMSDTKVALTYTGTSIFCVILTIAGNVITAGTPVGFVQTSYSSFGVQKISDTALLFCSWTKSFACVLGVNGTTVTVNQGLQFLTHQYFYLALVNSTDAIVYAREDTSSSVWGTFLLKIDGTTLSQTSWIATNPSISGNNGVTVFRKLAANKAVLFQRNLTTAYSEVVIMSVNNGTILLSTPLIPNAVVSSFQGNLCDITNDKKLLVFINNDANGIYSQVLNGLADSLAKATEPPFGGVAKQNGAGGESIEIFTL